MALTLKVKPGLAAQHIRTIPENWSAAWFRRFVTNYMENADPRNGVAIGMTVTGPVQNPTTFNVATSTGLAEPYLLATTPGDNVLANYRTIAGQGGVISISDGGPTHNLIIQVSNNGIGNAQLRQSAAGTVMGNPSGAPANVIDIDKPTLTSMIQVFGTALSGAVPASGGGTSNFLRADGTWQPIVSANPSASIGLSAVNGTATTFMTSDSAPALSQSIVPTWTGLHSFNNGLRVVGSGAGTAVVTLNTQATTGANTITISLTNFPGTNSGAKTPKYVPLTIDGSKFWMQVLPD